MKLTTQKLKQLVKEELNNLLRESIEQTDPELAQMLKDHPNATRAAGPDLQWMLDYLRQRAGDKKAMEFVYKLVSGGRGMLQAADEAAQLSGSYQDFTKSLKNWLSQSQGLREGN